MRALVEAVVTDEALPVVEGSNQYVYVTTRKDAPGHALVELRLAAAEARGLARKLDQACDRIEAGHRRDTIIVENGHRGSGVWQVGDGGGFYGACDEHEWRGALYLDYDDAAGELRTHHTSE